MHYIYSLSFGQQLWHVKFGMSSTPAHCSCAHAVRASVALQAYLSGWTVCVQFTTKETIAVFCWCLFRFDRLCFASFLFRFNPISSWSTLLAFRDARDFFLSQGFFNRSVRKYCRFPSLSFRSRPIWWCSWMGPDRFWRKFADAFSTSLIGCERRLRFAIVMRPLVTYNRKCF